MNMNNRMKLQNAEFDAADKFADALRAHNMTAVVDDDYPAVRHRYECALTALLEAVKANGHRRLHGQTFNTLRAANAARQQEWDVDNQITLAYRGNELAGEVGEACNVIKKLERERLGIKGSRDTIEHLAEELADVIICVDLIAMHQGIDLDEAVARKFNATSEKVGLKTRMAIIGGCGE